MQAASAAIGFRYFALVHHVDLSRATTGAIRCHNYPAAWAEHYDRHGFGATDPVHRASHRTHLGFLWSDLPSMIRLTGADRVMIALGGTFGLGQGMTVPVHVPGEPPGSCSFATGTDAPLDRSRLEIAQLVGMAAFDAARRLHRHHRPVKEPVRLTDRERDCLLWVARGKSDWEIARILGISEETVDRHLKHARDRYGVVKRTQAVVRALFDGTLSFAETLDH